MADTVGSHTRRARTRHPGVTIFQRTRRGRVEHHAKWTHPDNGQESINLDRLGKTNDESREAWARDKAAQLAAIRADRARGIAPEPEPEPEPEPGSIAAAKDEYLADVAARLREGTLRTYQQALTEFDQWAHAEGLTTLDQLTPECLAGFRSWLVARPKGMPRTGKGNRGQRKSGGQKRSPASINRVLRTVKGMLTEWRRHGLVSQLTADDIADRLRNTKQPRPKPTFLRPDDIAALLDAAVRHDAETFAMTRREKADGDAGGTPRHPAIAPFVATMLLLGMRFDEGRCLRWDAVHLDTDEDGEPCGIIALTDEYVKTGHARDIDLRVAPAAQRILSALRLQAAPNAVYVFGDGAEAPTRDLIESCRKRLVSTFGAPAFDWQELRRTAGVYMANSASMFGQAAIYAAAVQLGHAVAVSERNYLRRYNGVPRSARTMGATMSADDHLQRVLDSVAIRPVALTPTIRTA